MVRKHERGVACLASMSSTFEHALTDWISTDPLNLKVPAQDRQWHREFIAPILQRGMLKRPV